MAQFKAFEEGMQVNGATIMAVVDGLNFFSGGVETIAKKYLADAGLSEVVPDSDHWYPQQAWLDAFKKISDELGEENLFMIGKKIPENAVFPPEVDDIEKGLASIDVAYHMNHKNAGGDVLFDPSRGPRMMLEGIGHYEYSKVEGKNSAIIKCENPYPDDFDRGIIEAIARRFNKLARVKHDDSAPCRKNGAESCTYIVTWA